MLFSNRQNEGQLHLTQFESSNFFSFPAMGLKVKYVNDADIGAPIKGRAFDATLAVDFLVRLTPIHLATCFAVVYQTACPKAILGILTNACPATLAKTNLIASAAA
jgi:hypothetical protein